MFDDTSQLSFTPAQEYFLIELPHLKIWYFDYCIIFFVAVIKHRATMEELDLYSGGKVHSNPGSMAADSLTRKLRSHIFSCNPEPENKLNEVSQFVLRAPTVLYLLRQGSVS